ncbi:MAG: EpsG family protein [Lachnospiraceae bacterium]|nr:EpsG family protein [Lachnospiraceae bacterium]
MIYFVTFMISVLFFYVGNKTSSKSVKRVLHIVALFLPILLSAFRAVSVGRDTGFYAYPVFRIAKTYDSFFSFIGYDGLEPGFLFLEYVGANIFDSFPFVLGSMQFITNYCVYRTICELGEEKNLPVGMLVFYFLGYGSSLNVIRQYAAAALILLAFAYLKNKKYVLCCVMIGLAYLFHTTALLAILFIGIYFIVYNKQVFYIFLTLVLIIAYHVITSWKEVFPIIFKYVTVWRINYSAYLDYYSMGDRNETAILLALISILIVGINMIKDNSEWNRFLLMMSIIYLVGQPMVEQINVISRVLIYPSIILVITYPMLNNIIRIRYINHRKYNLAAGILCVLLFASWYYTVILNNANEIIPYEFAF